MLESTVSADTTNAKTLFVYQLKAHFILQIGI